MIRVEPSAHLSFVDIDSQDRIPDTRIPSPTAAMHTKCLSQIILILSSSALFAKPFLIQIPSVSSAISASAKEPYLCLTQQRGYFCGSRSIPGWFDPLRPIFKGRCDENTRYTCVARAEYPFPPREAVSCGPERCHMEGGPDEAFGFDDCGA